MAEHIGDRIKKARLEKKMTQDDLAKTCGIKRASVSLWESGQSKSPTAENVLLISRALGKSLTWLIEGREDLSLQPTLLHSPRTQSLLERLGELVAEGRVSEGALQMAVEEVEKKGKDLSLLVSPVASAVDEMIAGGVLTTEQMMLLLKFLESLKRQNVKTETDIFDELHRKLEGDV